MTREAALDQVTQFVRHGSEDDVKILLFVMNRLALGHGQYGGFRLDRDPRNFMREASEEAADWMVYVAAATIKEGLKDE